MTPYPKAEGQPRRKTPPSKRGYKVVYLTGDQKSELLKAATAAKAVTLADYIMTAHRAYQAQQKARSI